MKLATLVFRIAGIYGLLVTFPLYFIEQKISLDYPPAINHAEYYYSFIGVTVVWQILFFVIAGDPARYRKLMILSMLEKVSLVPTFLVLFPQGRFPVFWLPLMTIDLILCVLFAIAYIRTRES
jgi:hypothetical protein